MGGNGIDWARLFDEGDPFDDPRWQQAALMVDAPPRPAKGYVTCPLAWLARITPVIRTSDQLVVAMLLYRRCLIRRSKTVDLPNGDLKAAGISRQTKYRALAELEGAGAVTIEAHNGRPIRVTLHWFP
jgi:hypothetical protein